MSDLVHVNKQHFKKQAEKEEDRMYRMWNCIFIFNKWDGEEVLYIKKNLVRKGSNQEMVCSDEHVKVIATWVQDLNLALELKRSKEN